MKREQLALGVVPDERLGFHCYEEESYARGFKSIAGIDEVGRGPLAGPVIAAAVMLPRGYSHPEIKDSKLLSANQRERLSAVIREKAVCWALGVAAVEDIDRLNILQASLLAMVKALAALKQKADCVFLDGNQTIPLPLFRAGEFLAGRTVYQKTIIKGDRFCLSIAAASIVAKVARDDMMVELDKRYPEYGFAAHKGYSCAEHLDALKRFGPSPAHRQSFKPVREAVTDGTNLGPLFETWR
jgi:ribonuclease HII